MFSDFLELLNEDNFSENISINGEEINKNKININPVLGDKLTKDKKELKDEISKDDDNEDDEDQDDDQDDGESNLSLVAMETEIKGSILEIIDGFVDTFKQIQSLNDRRLGRLQKGEQFIERSEKKRNLLR